MAELKPGQGMHRVVGHVAVVQILDGSERYLYRGAVFNAAQADAARVKHLLSVGLIEKAAKSEPAAAPDPKTDAEKTAAEAKAADQKPAAEKK